MEKRIFVLLIFLSSVQLLSGQTDINKQLPGKPVKQKKGLTEIEITMIGLGINRVYPKKQFSMGWGVSAFYVNYIILTSYDKYETLKSRDRRRDVDFLRLKMINRIKLTKFNDLDINPIFSLSYSTPRDDYYSSIGFNINLCIFKLKHIKVATEIQLRKSIRSGDYIMSINPIIFTVKF